MKELGIFIDESGNFGDIINTSPYYIVTFVFHNQQNDISFNVERFEKQIKNCGFANEHVHTHPLIKKSILFIIYRLMKEGKHLIKCCDLQYLVIFHISILLLSQFIREKILLQTTGVIKKLFKINK